MKIQAISSWQNGQEKLGTEFNLRIINDNLLDSATFYYNICSEEVSHLEKVIMTPATETEEETYYEQKVIDSYAQQLVDGNLAMSKEEYQIWDSSVDVNLSAYQWAASKLNLVLITE